MLRVFRLTLTKLRSNKRINIRLAKVYETWVISLKIGSHKVVNDHSTFCYVVSSTEIWVVTRSFRYYRILSHHRRIYFTCKLENIVNIHPHTACLYMSWSQRIFVEVNSGIFHALKHSYI